MKYASEQEKQFVDDAIKNDTYRIDYAYGQVLKLSMDGLSYMHDFSFYGLGVTSKNSDRYIIRAIYRADEMANYRADEMANRRNHGNEDKTQRRL